MKTCADILKDITRVEKKIDKLTQQRSELREETRTLAKDLLAASSRDFVKRAADAVEAGKKVEVERTDQRALAFTAEGGIHPVSVPAERRAVREVYSGRSRFGFRFAPNGYVEASVFGSKYPTHVLVIDGAAVPFWASEGVRQIYLKSKK
jgi:hypothetical protein